MRMYCPTVRVIPPGFPFPFIVIFASPRIREKHSTFREHKEPLRCHSASVRNRMTRGGFHPRVERLCLTTVWPSKPVRDIKKKSLTREGIPYHNSGLQLNSSSSLPILRIVIPYSDFFSHKWNDLPDWLSSNWIYHLSRKTCLLKWWKSRSGSPCMSISENKRVEKVLVDVKAVTYHQERPNKRTREGWGEEEDRKQGWQVRHTTLGFNLSLQPTVRSDLISLRSSRFSPLHIRPVVQLPFDVLFTCSITHPLKEKTVESHWLHPQTFLCTVFMSTNIACDAERRWIECRQRRV